MITTQEIKKMSRVEKIRLMEDLWADITSNDEIESPQWHEDALAETERSIAEGTEERMDWNTAKKKLRSKFE